MAVAGMPTMMLQRITSGSLMPRRWYWRWATSVLGTVAGSGEATAMIGGTPMAASSGVASAEPPLPNMPPRNPTTVPISTISSQGTSPGDHDAEGAVQDRSSLESIEWVYGAAAAALRPRRRRARARSRPPPRRASWPSRRSPTPIRALERDLGVELFHRIGRRAQLTPAGEAFVPAARQVLRAVDAVRAEVGAVVDLITGRLDLVALPTLAVDPVAALVGAFRKRYPGVMVRLAHPGHAPRGRPAPADRPRRARHHRGARGRGAHRHPPARAPGARRRAPARFQAAAAPARWPRSPPSRS